MSNTINGVVLKDIKFGRDRVNMLLRGGILLRSEIVGGTSAEVVIKDAPFAKAHRILAHTNNIMVYHNNDWTMIRSTNPDWSETLRKMYEEDLVNTPHTYGVKVETGETIKSSDLSNEITINAVSEQVPTSSDVVEEDTVEEEETPATLTEEVVADSVAEDSILDEDKVTKEEEPEVAVTLSEEEATELGYTNNILPTPSDDETKIEPIPIESDKTFAASKQQPIHSKKKHKH